MVHGAESAIHVGDHHGVSGFWFGPCPIVAITLLRGKPTDGKIIFHYSVFLPLSSYIASKQIRYIFKVWSFLLKKKIKYKAFTNKPQQIDVDFQTRNIICIQNFGPSKHII